MHRKQFLATLVMGAILVFVLSVSLLLPASVLAQCGEPPEPSSSCITCHAKEAPVSDQGEWHIIHADKDICINCHGGNASAREKNLAHEGLMAHPLADIYTDCHSCHLDYEARAAEFAPILGVTPGSCATPTAVAMSSIRRGPTSGNVVIPSDLVTTASLPSPFSIIAGGVAMLTFFLLGLGWLARHPA